MKLTRRKFIAGVGAVSLLSPFQVLSLSEKKKFRVLLNSGYSSPQAFFFLADDRGYFKRENIEVEFVEGEGAAAIVPKIIPKGFDFGYGDLNALIDLAGNDLEHAPVAVYVTFNTTPLTIAVAADGPIKIPKDFEGKIIGGHPSDAALRAFPAFANRADIDPSKVKFARSSVSMTQLVDDMLNEKTAGVFGFVNTITKASAPLNINVSERLRFIEFKDFTPELYGNALMVSRDLIRKDPEAVKAFVRAANLGLIDTVNDLERAMDSVMKRKPSLDRGSSMARLKGTLQMEMANPEGSTIGIGDVDDARLAKSIALVSSTYLLPNIPKPAQIFTRQFLPPADERLKTLGAKRAKYKILLNSGFSGAQAWFYLAEDRGYFKEEGIDLEFTLGKGAYTAAPRVVPENFDIAYGDINSMIEVVSRNPGNAPMAVYIMFNASPSTIMVPAKSQIKTLKDLEGKKIVGHPSDVALETFGAFADHAGIDATKVTSIPGEGGMGDFVQKVLAGEVDAMFGYVTTITAAAQRLGIDLDQIRFIPYKDVLPDFLGSCVMVSPNFLNNHPGAILGIVRAINRGVADAVNNPKAAIESVYKRDSNLNKEIELARLTGTFEGEMSHAEGKTLGIGDVSDQRLEYVIKLLARTKGLPRVPATSEIFTRRFLPLFDERVVSLAK